MCYDPRGTIAAAEVHLSQPRDGAVLDQYPDRWALVTGATSGIGEAFAHKLAARGMHLVVTSLYGELLPPLVEQLHVRHGTRCEAIAADLSDPGEVKGLIAEIDAKEIVIELLVNNAGFGIVADVENTNPPDVLRMLSLNIAALTDLTYWVLPGMLERQHGAILNVASRAALQPVAYMPAYAASKAYVLHFSEALWAEVYDRGVTVMALCPGVTRTAFYEIAGVPAWLKKHRSLAPEQVVKSALKGLERRKPYCVPGWRDYLAAMLPRIASRKKVVRESMKYFRPQPKSGQVPAHSQEPDAAR